MEEKSRALGPCLFLSEQRIIFVLVELYRNSRSLEFLKHEPPVRLYSLAINISLLHTPKFFGIVWPHWVSGTWTCVPLVNCSMLLTISDLPQLTVDPNQPPVCFQLDTVCKAPIFVKIKAKSVLPLISVSTIYCKSLKPSVIPQTLDLCACPSSHILRILSSLPAKPFQGCSWELPLKWPPFKFSLFSSGWASQPESEGQSFKTALLWF